MVYAIKVYNFRRRSNCLFCSLLLLLSGCAQASAIKSADGSVRIGYFHGGRTQAVLRASTSGFFDQEGVDVKVITKDLSSDEYYELPKTDEGIVKVISDKTEKKIKELGSGNSSPTVVYWGKVKGTEIIDLIKEGKLDGGTVGESSFLQKIDEGAPLLAVALLGHERDPGKAITLRNPIAINKKEDWKGKVLTSRRAGAADLIFLMEFLEREGISRDEINIIKIMDEYDPEGHIKLSRLKDKVNVVPQVDENQNRQWFEKGVIDGSLQHLNNIKWTTGFLGTYVYRVMDWIPPSMSQALLVFHRDYVRDHPQIVQRVINGYMKRIKFEKENPDVLKNVPWLKGLANDDEEYQAMSMPDYDYPPQVKVELLMDMQKLMRKYGFLENGNNVAKYIDNSFVMRAFQALQ